MNQDTTGILAQAQFLATAEQLAEAAPVDGGLGTILHLQIACGVLIAFIVIRLLIAHRGLSRVFRRTVNPLLLLATVASLIFGVLLFTALGAAKTAFDAQDLTGPSSVSMLWQARATAAQMHASESRWLLWYGESSGQHSNAMDAERQIFTGGQKWITILPQLPRNVVDELNVYLMNDQHLTSTMTDGAGTFTSQLRAGVAYTAVTIDPAYAKFDTDLTQVIGVDQQSFAAATAKGENGLVTWLWLPWLWIAASIALILLAFTPRLREYR
jgi:hypothetical protein